MNEDEEYVFDITEITDLQYTLFQRLPGGGAVMLANSLILATYVKYKTLRRETGFTAIALLAGFDLLNGLSAIVNGLVQLFTPAHFTETICLIRYTFSTHGKCLSELGILYVTVDRFMAIRHSVKYRLLNHGKLAVRFLVAVALFQLVVWTFLLWVVGKDTSAVVEGASCPAMADVMTKLTKVFYVLFSTTLGTTVVVLYLFILHGIKSASSQIQTKTNMTNTMKLARQNEMRAHRSINLVLLAYILLCVLPNMAANVTTIMGVRTMHDIKYMAVATGSLINSCLNILIYSIRHQAFHEHFLAFLKGRTQSEFNKEKLQIQIKQAQFHHRTHLAKSMNKQLEPVTDNRHIHKDEITALPAAVDSQGFQ